MAAHVLDHGRCSTQQTGEPEESLEPDGEEIPPPGPDIPLGIVLARILIVSGMGFAGALMIFFLVGGFWLVAGLSALATVVFMALMFTVERFAER